MPPPTRSPASCRKRSRARRLHLGGDRALGEGQRAVAALGGRIDIWSDAGALPRTATAEVATVGREELTDRKVQGSAVIQPLGYLEDPLSVRVRADNLGTPVILERGGD